MAAGRASRQQAIENSNAARPAYQINQFAFSDVTTYQ
jgi:hypothetical protein